MMKRILTKHLLIPAVAIIMFAFGDTSQNSFSQEMKKPQVPAGSTQIPVSDRKFVIDTTYLNELLSKKIDSLKKEHEETGNIIEVGKKTIKVQKVNHSNLKRTSYLMKNSLELAGDEDFELPPIELIYAKKKPRPLSVDIKPLNPDTLIVPVQKRGVLRFLKFWK